MKRLAIPFVIITLVVIGSSCTKGDLSLNPNAAGSNAIINPDLFVNRMTFEMYNGGGATDGYSNNVKEGPWWPVHRWNQFFVSNYSYYWGSNFYNWTNSANNFSVLKYANLLQQQALAQGAANSNQAVYLAIAKFFKVYSFIWYSQRVGDIPFSEAGSETNLTPKFDSQHDVYKGCLAILDTANAIMGAYIAKNPSLTNSTASAGDIYGLTNLGWQKAINSYKLRLLISLSKRAADNADLNIPGQFASIVNNPATYPIMTNNGDNLIFKFNAAYNPYPIKVYGTQPYSQFANVSNTFLNLTTPVDDPRTFIAATPAPAQVTAMGTPPLDFSNAFTAFVGADISVVQGTLNANSANGMYSFGNYRYYKTNDGSSCEPAIVMGYPEVCFSVAEGINRGWAAGNDGQWYLNGVNASLSFYGLVNGSSFPVNDKTGAALGTAIINIPKFLTNVAYAGNGSAAGLTQILQQKYVAMWQNSGWEPYYNWRRTGLPAFAEGGPGIGTTSGNIQVRWLYDNNEIVANAANYGSAIQSQYGGTDDVTKEMWLIKP